MLENVDLFIHALTSFLVALKSERALLVGQARLVDAATAARVQEPRELVLQEAVVELATSAHSQLKLVSRFLPGIKRWLALIGQWRSRVDHTYDRIVELKVFVGGDQEA